MRLLEGDAVDDPFQPTAELVGLLRERAVQLRRRGPPAAVLTLEPLLARARARALG